MVLTAVTLGNLNLFNLYRTQHTNRWLDCLDIAQAAYNTFDKDNVTVCYTKANIDDYIEVNDIEDGNIYTSKLLESERVSIVIQGRNSKNKINLEMLIYNNTPNVELNILIDTDKQLESYKLNKELFKEYMDLIEINAERIKERRETIADLLKILSNNSIKDDIINEMKKVGLELK